MVTVLPMNDTAAKIRKYRVLYSVTRAEYYEIEATSPKEATQRGFCDGKLVEAGETTDVIECAIEEITTTAHEYDQEHRLLLPLQGTAPDILAEHDQQTPFAAG